MYKCRRRGYNIVIMVYDSDRKKARKSHKVRTTSGKTHNFTARQISLNKLAAKKLNVAKLQKELEKEKSILDASDIPIR